MTQTSHLSLVPAAEGEILEGEILEAEETTTPLLSLEEAQELTETIRLALSVAWDGLGRAYAGQAWRVLGYSSWEIYCASEFGGQRLKLTPSVRREVFGKLHREFAMSARAIEAASGYNKSTVAADLKHPDAGCQDVTTSLGRDGVTRRKSTRQPATVPPAGLTGVARTLWWVTAAGAEGLTVKDLLARETSWHHGIASCNLSRLKARGKITPAEGRRDGCRPFVAVPEQAGE